MKGEGWIQCDFKINQEENDKRQINCLRRKHFKLSFCPLLKHYRHMLKQVTQLQVVLLHLKPSLTMAKTKLLYILVAIL